MIVHLEPEDWNREQRAPEEMPCEDWLGVLMFVKQSEKLYTKHLGTLGLEGCLFKTSVPVVLGQKMELKLFLDGLESVQDVRGTVVRLIATRHYAGVVVRFQDLPFEAERMIARWMDKRTGIAYGDKFIS